MVEQLFVTMARREAEAEAEASRELSVSALLGLGLFTWTGPFCPCSGAVLLLRESPAQKSALVAEPVSPQSTKIKGCNICLPMEPPCTPKGNLIAVSLSSIQTNWRRKTQIGRPARLLVPFLGFRRPGFVLCVTIYPGDCLDPWISYPLLTSCHGNGHPGSVIGRSAS